MDAVMLDCRLMTAKKEAHEYIAQKLGFPDYYGKNLDALYDCLTEFCRKKLIVLRFTSALGDNLGKYGDSLLSVFTDADGEGKISLVITEK
ncbi:MAG: barstar family protein [Clostridia bacterium]|nr:barstar family protein [Clostridia bacterium]MBQ3870933.1 barstar family protein [Clostridia bacterium]